MDRETIRRIIVEGQEYISEIPLNERPFLFEKNGNYVFVGMHPFLRYSILFLSPH